MLFQPMMMQLATIKYITEKVGLVAAEGKEIFKKKKVK